MTLSSRKWEGRMTSTTGRRSRQFTYVNSLEKGKEWVLGILSSLKCRIWLLITQTLHMRTGCQLWHFHISLPHSFLRLRLTHSLQSAKLMNVSISISRQSTRHNGKWDFQVLKIPSSNLFNKTQVKTLSRPIACHVLQMLSYATYSWTVTHSRPPSQEFSLSLIGKKCNYWGSASKV